jgi:hypothetical protein
MFCVVEAEFNGNNVPVVAAADGEFSGSSSSNQGRLPAMLGGRPRCNDDSNPLLGL